MTKERDDAMAEFSTQIAANLQTAAARFAAEFKQPTNVVYAEIVQSLYAGLEQSVGIVKDKRSTAYQVRLTLFKDGALEADTDPEWDDNTPGNEVIHGLAAVGIWAREIAQSFHGSDVVGGLDDEAIVRSIKSLRPSLSRNNGTHNWRLPYTVDGHEGYTANILVVTVNDAATTA